MGASAISMFNAAMAAGDPIGAIAVASGLLLPAAVAVACVVRLRLVADDSGLLVVNVLASRRIRWDEIIEARAGYHGIGIQMRDGDYLVAKVAQKANASKWRGARTRADEIAQAINDRSAGRG